MKRLEYGSIRVGNARLICPTTGLDRQGAVDIRDGRIEGVHVDGAAPPTDLRFMDGRGAILCPGFIDLHATSGEPGYEYRETLADTAAAAIRGGFTTVCIGSNSQTNHDTRPMTEYFVRRSQEIGLAKLAPIGALTSQRAGARLTEMYDLKAGGAIAYGDGESACANAGIMRRALEYASATGRPVFEFPNNPSLSGTGVMHEGPVSTLLGLKGIPSAAEEVRVYRAIALARLTRAPIHLGPISTAASVSGLRAAKAEGLPLTSAVTAAHLTFVDADIKEGWSTSLKVMPVLRSELDRDALISGLQDGTIDAVASGHNPMGLVDKQVPFQRAEFGMLGLQTALGQLLALVDAGRLTLGAALRSLTTGAAACLRTDIPALEAGALADLVLFEPGGTTEFTPGFLAGKSFNTPFLNQSLPGKVVATIVDGRRVYFNSHDQSEPKESP